MTQERRDAWRHVAEHLGHRSYSFTTLNMLQAKFERTVRVILFTSER
jgi:hypothetical protein